MTLFSAVSIPSLIFGDVIMTSVQFVTFLRLEEICVKMYHSLKYSHEIFFMLESKWM